MYYTYILLAQIYKLYKYILHRYMNYTDTCITQVHNLLQTQSYILHRYMSYTKL